MENYKRVSSYSPTYSPQIVELRERLERDLRGPETGLRDT